MWKKIQSQLGTGLFIGFLMFMGWGVFFNEANNKGLPPSANPSHIKPSPIFSQPVQPLPQTGDNNSSFGKGVAPLKIKTSTDGGYHYFVKLVNTENRQELGRYFIRSGGVLDIKVPVGIYEIKYATGKQWYGTNYLFGPETIYNKADSKFDFSFDGYQYSGYTVELIMQQNGNLGTLNIQQNQW